MLLLMAMKSVKYKTIGVLGGMGPAASWYFEKVLMDLNTAAVVDQDYPTVIHFSNSQIPGRIDALLGKGISPVSEIISSFEKLRVMGADFGVMICNTAHIYWEEILKGTTLPLLHLPVETGVALSSTHPKLKKILLLATKQTIEFGIYREPLINNGIEIILPDQEGQSIVSEAIFNLSYGIKATRTRVSEKAKADLRSVVEEVAKTKEIDCALCGCTEISMALGQEPIGEIKVIDALHLLARKCLSEAGVESIEAD